MIKFFRHIRRTLINQNQMGKYFKYAVGEILLVVIGILIALQINNWNENNKERAIETSYLKRLLIDLEENNTLWEQTLKRKEKQLAAAHIFLNFKFSKNQDSVAKLVPHFLALGNWKDININQVTFNEMVSSGTVNIITNDSIKIKLLDLDKLYNAIINNQELLKQEHNNRLHEPTMNIVNTSYAFAIDPNQNKAIKRKFSEKELSSYSSLFQNDLMSLINDKSFANGIVGITYNAQSQFFYFEQAIAQVNELIALIKKEIGPN